MLCVGLLVVVGLTNVRDSDFSNGRATAQKKLSKDFLGSLSAREESAMKQPIKILFACGIAVALGSIFASPSSGQQPVQPTQESIDIAKLIGEIEQQQTQFTANQDDMEKRMTAIAEEMRMAKIHASRGGGAGK